jgi:hypothetical protein
MTLEDWDKEGKWLKKEATSFREISDLLAIVERNLKDASIEELSPDARLSLAFAAALNCATIALRASGYRLPSTEGHHYKTIDSLRFTLKPDPKSIIRLQAFRGKRKQVTYENVGTTSDTEVVELIKIAKNLRDTIKKWLKDNYSELIN